MYEYILFACLVLGIIFLLIGLIVLYSNNKKLKQDLFLNQEKLKDAQNFAATLKSTTDKIVEGKEFGCENRIIELNQRIAEKQEELTRVNEEISDVQEQLWDIAIALKALNGTYVQKSAEVVKMDEETSILLASENVLKESMKALETKITSLAEEIERLKKIQRQALLEENEIKQGWWDIYISPKENELISILNKIKLDYPDLKTDIATIEWRRIWLPKLQNLCNEHELNCRGIYRLVLKENENVCYVGQAVNIQDRWYQHAKKMLGVDGKGNEKLYDYRPEDFYWSVLETGDEVDLNKSERYWIDYYCCKEKGLNKK